MQPRSKWIADFAAVEWRFRVDFSWFTEEVRTVFRGVRFER
jgi:hypothetical protein